MSLFQQLRYLCSSERFQIEDFHTEIVAQVLHNSPALTLDWLRGIGATNLQAADHIGIDTQERFTKLENHTAGSRLDLTIRLVANGRTELIFVESKLPSKQGVDQLQKYAEQLSVAHAEEPLTRTSLVFITREYEATEKPKVSDPSYDLTFCTTRWFVFYRYLKAHLNGDGLAKELKLFMEENHMSTGNQFRSIDLVALENFLRAKALMDETLAGEVSDELQDILGELWPVKRALGRYLRDDHRYVVSNCNWETFEFHVGYWLPYENLDDSVWVGVTIYSNPSAKARKDVIAAFRDWLKVSESEWSAEELDDPKARSCIFKGRPLPTMMAGADHVRATKDYFLSLLEEVCHFRKRYPKLPWAGAGTPQPKTGPSSE